MDIFDSLESLQKSIEIQKEKIQTTDVSIKKITGRAPGDERRVHSENTNLTTLKRQLDNGPPVIYSKLDPIYQDHRNVRVTPKDRPDEDLKFMLPSSIVQVGEKRSRSDALKELKSSERDRGRRMLCVLQSTLNQFKVESKAATDLPMMARRRKLESRIEEKAVKEKEALRNERQDLFRRRREQQLELGLLNQKMRMINGFEAWKEETMKMVGFIRTDLSPHIFYRPRQDCPATTERKDATKEKILEMIKVRRAKLESDFQEMASARRRRLGLSSNSSIGTELSTSKLLAERFAARAANSSDRRASLAEDGECDDDFALEDDDDEEWIESSENGHVASHVSKVVEPMSASAEPEAPLSDFEVDEPVVVLEEQAVVEPQADRRRVLLTSD